MPIKLLAREQHKTVLKRKRARSKLLGFEQHQIELDRNKAWSELWLCMESNTKISWREKKKPTLEIHSRVPDRHSGVCWHSRHLPEEITKSEGARTGAEVSTCVSIQHN